MAKKGLCIALTIVILLLLPGVSHALMDNQKVLVGLQGVWVVPNIDPQAEKLGLTKDQIQTDVELRLRKAGVRVLTAMESILMPGKPYLYVAVSSLVSPGPVIVAFSITVELSEDVTLTRGPETSASIWSKQSVGTVGMGRTREIRESVCDLVDKFINDYLAANPKK